MTSATSTRSVSGRPASPAPEASRRKRLEGVAEIVRALDRDAPVFLVLCREGRLAAESEDLLARARGLGIPIRVESEREMRRMSASTPAREILALEGPAPAVGIDELMSREGLVLVLAGLRYPGNVGFIMRSAEVAGLAGVVVSNDWTGDQMHEARRIGMHADRFFGVLEASIDEAIRSARRHDRRIVAIETDGDRAPWGIDWTRPCVALIGGETTGLTPEQLVLADEVVRIPTRGFIPSYNVQAAVGIILGEVLRQNDPSAD